MYEEWTDDEMPVEIETSIPSISAKSVKMMCGRLETIRLSGHLLLN
jgi:hypothetical protein